MQYANIPHELREYNQWINWRYVERNGISTKEPINPHTGGKASVTDAATWSSYDHAIYNIPHCDGIGFVLTKYDPYLFIDLDAGGDPAIQQQIFAAFDTYVELSPSGTGLHLIARGSVEHGLNARKAGVEIYSDGRYMTMTGNVYRDTAIARVPHHDLQSLVAHLREHYQSATPSAGLQAPSELPTRADREIYEAALAARNGAKFAALWAGQWHDTYPSQSEADNALCNILAHYTRNHEQMIRLFLHSGLGQREKAHKADYQMRLVKRAFDRTVPLVDSSAITAQIQSQIVEKEAAHAAAIAAARQARYQDRMQAAESALTVPSPQEPPPPVPSAPIPGLVGRVAAWVQQASPYPHPVPATVAALSYIASIAGRAFNVLGNGCNIYMLYVAPTGSGKESMASGLSKLTRAVEKIHPSITTIEGPGYLASGQALATTLRSQPCCLSILGEFADTLKAMAHPRASPGMVMLNKALLDVFGKSGHGQMLGSSAFADREKKQDALRSPCLSILAETAPAKFYSHLNEDMVTGGLLPRFSLFECAEYTREFNAPFERAKPDDQLVSDISALAMRCMQIDQSGGVVHIEFDSAAHREAQWYQKKSRDKLIGSSDEIVKNLWSRAHMKACKLAALIAIGQLYDPLGPWRNPDGDIPVVTLDVFRMAMQMINSGTELLIRKFETNNVGDGDYRAVADIEKVLDRFMTTSNARELPRSWRISVKDHAQGLIQLSQLRQAVGPTQAIRTGQGGATNTFYRALKMLMSEGKITEFTESRGVVYRVNPDAFRRGDEIGNDE